jgi:hypothetical protein
MKRLSFLFLLGILGTLTLQAQIVHTDNVEIEKSGDATLDLTDTNNNETWQLVSGLAGFRIGYLTGGLTGNTAPFFIKANGYVGMLMTNPGNILDPLTVNGNIRIYDANAGIKLGSKPFISAPNSGSNTFLGVDAGKNNDTGTKNLFVGFEAGRDNTEGIENLFLGNSAGQQNTVGDYNTFIGRSAGLNNLDGNKNMFLGRASGQNNQSGSDNIYMGYWAGLNAKGSQNVLIGSESGMGNNTATENTYVGYATGKGNLNNDGQNTLIGSRAGSSSSGSKNVALGYRAGLNTEGEKNVFIGYNAGVGVTTGSNRLYIGNNSVGQPGGKLIYGEFDNGKIGINTTSPEATLHVSADSNLKQLRLERTGTDAGVSGDIGGSDGNLIFYPGGYDVKTGDVIFDTSGNVGIGTTTPNAKLEVNGDALIQGDLESMKVVVTATPGGNWPDYVFQPEFKLRPLSEVEAFVKDNKHLPEVPSAEEVEKNGIDLGSMDATLLKKVEELTLYMIQMNKEIEKLKEENKQLKELVKKEK